MRVMVLVKATNDSETGMMPPTGLLEAMGKFNEQLVDAGILLAGDGLHPSAKGKRVAFDGPGRTVIDGPFDQTRELVAGALQRHATARRPEAIKAAEACRHPLRRR